MPIAKFVNKDFFKNWSSDMAYVVGFFAADGYITLNQRKGQFWSIQITDKELLEEIKKVLKSEHKIGVRLGRKPNKSTAYRLQIGSTEMCEDLQKLGMTERKTKSLVIPSIPDKFLSEFIRGYFDGDGNVWIGYLNKHRENPTLGLQTAFTSCSKNFLNSLLQKLRGLGIEKGGVYEIKDTYSRLQLSTTDSLKLYDFMYNRLGSSKLFLKRKKDVFEKYKKLRL